MTSLICSFFFVVVLSQIVKGADLGCVYIFQETMFQDQVLNLSSLSKKTS